jgi:hypothetical protein
VLPFEFRALEVALEAACSFLDARTTELESEAYPVLDELTNKVRIFGASVLPLLQPVLPSKALLLAQLLALADGAPCKADILVHFLPLKVLGNLAFGVMASPSDALSVPFCPSSISKSFILTTFVLKQRLTEAGR